MDANDPVFEPSPTALQIRLFLYPRTQLPQFLGSLSSLSTVLTLFRHRNGLDSSIW